jgi:hypothetical protein
MRLNEKIMTAVAEWVVKAENEQMVANCNLKPEP